MSEESPIYGASERSPFVSSPGYAPLELWPSQSRDRETLSGDGGAATARGEWNPNDVWMTPPALAKDIVEYFKPVGAVLDPCRGDGAFSNAMPGCEWCEIREGKDFFRWSQRADWIVSNPPYSIFTEFMAHAMTLADNIVWLIPLHKPFGSWPRLSELRQWGWMRHIRIYGRSRSYGLDVGFVCGAVHFQRQYAADTSWSFPAVAGARLCARAGQQEHNGAQEHNV